MRWRTLAVGAALVIGSTTSPARADSFYAPPEPLPTGRPGDVIRSKPIDAPMFPGAAAWLVLYRSSDVQGRAIAVSGTVFVPRESYSGTRPIVVLTPGTRGLPDKCAPSKQYQASSMDPDALDYEIPIVTQLLARRIAVVVTDYEGAGTPGLPTYVVGRPEGYAGLDALRAAQRLRIAGLPRNGPVGIAGYSQGGQAAGWTAELQPSYAPELKLRGVALGGVPADVHAVESHLNGKSGMGFAIAALSGLDVAFPELRLDERYLTPVGRDVMRQIRQEQCAWTIVRQWDGRRMSELTKPDVLQQPNWKRRFAESRLGRKPLPAPAYLYHGTQDQWIPFDQFELLRRAWCKRGATIEFGVFTGTDHVQTLEAATVPAVDWLTDRFAGQPAPNDC